MTAYRIITDHEELDGSGQLTHDQIDAFIDTSPFVIVSGAAGSQPPNSRQLSAGDGITVTDNGPGNKLVIAIQHVSGSSGSITPFDHMLLRQLVHLADVDGPRGIEWASGYLREQGPFPFPTASIWWTDSSKSKKLMEQVVVRNPIRLITTSSWRVFDFDGVTVVDSFTDLITYRGVVETSRTRIEP
jgi:hypothetical protein